MQCSFAFSVLHSVDVIADSIKMSILLYTTKIDKNYDDDETQIIIIIKNRKTEPSEIRLSI